MNELLGTEAMILIQPRAWWIKNGREWEVTSRDVYHANKDTGYIKSYRKDGKEVKLYLQNLMPNV